MPFERRGKGATKSSASQYPINTKPSVFNGQLLCSCGVPDLDGLTGGGLPLGTLCLIEEDVYGNYSNTFLTSFMAEGVACQHVVICVDSFPVSHDVVSSLPYITSSSNPTAMKAGGAAKQVHTPQPQETPKQTGDLKIAWQYEKYATTKSASVEASPISQRVSQQKQVSIGTTASTQLNYHQKLQPELVKQAKVIRISVEELTDSLVSEGFEEHSAPFTEKLYCNIITQIKQVMDDEKQQAAQHTTTPVLFRIAIPHFASFVDSSLTHSGHKHEEFKFLYQLKGVVRTSYCVCQLSVSSNTHQQSHLQQLQHLCDIVIQLASWDGAGVQGVTPSDYDEYTGRLDLLKLPRLNSLVSWNNSVLRFGFRVRSNGMIVIARFTLQPEISRDQENKTVAAQNAESAAKANAKALEW